jgi:hypothetical protein
MNNIKEISICDVMDVIFPNFEDQIRLTWEDECKVVLDFCEKNNYMLYERVREQFFKWEGYELAVKGGYSGVVYSDLS